MNELLWAAIAAMACAMTGTIAIAHRRISCVTAQLAATTARLSQIADSWQDCRSRDRSVHEQFWDYIEQYDEKLQELGRRIATLENQNGRI